MVVLIRKTAFTVYPLLALLLFGGLAGCVPAGNTTDEQAQAREALTTYFELLSNQQYAEAADYYGGDYELLQGYNPDVAADDVARLLERACTSNGFVCLPVQSVVAADQLAPDQFQFTVEFAEPDGSTFVLGPCCGANETEMPPQSQFTYTIRQVGDQYLVQELPVYRP